MSYLFDDFDLDIQKTAMTSDSVAMLNGTHTVGAFTCPGLGTVPTVHVNTCQTCNLSCRCSVGCAASVGGIGADPSICR